MDQRVRVSIGAKSTRSCDRESPHEDESVENQGESMSVIVRVATRRSALALAQTRMMIAALKAKGAAGLLWEEFYVVTEGDRIQDRPLNEIGGKGLFIKELEHALVQGDAEFAVHSMKDLPANLAPGLAVVSVPERESPWDLLVTRDGIGLDALPEGARVGTTSLRRRIQLLARRPDLTITQLRGNIDTRLRRLESGDFDAIVLAEAGVRRLGLNAHSVRLTGVVIPAIGQGALAIEADPAQLASCTPALTGIAEALEHRSTRVATDAERAVQRALGADCVTPLGAHARVDLTAGTLEMQGFLATADGARHVSAHASGGCDDPEAVGRSLAEALRQRLDG
jgi:hydroxymethylbilane synthase